MERNQLIKDTFYRGSRRESKRKEKRIRPFRDYGQQESGIFWLKVLESMHTDVVKEEVSQIAKPVSHNA